VLAKLKATREPGESYSDVIIRVARPRCELVVHGLEADGGRSASPKDLVHAPRRRVPVLERDIVAAGLFPSPATHAVFLSRECYTLHKMHRHRLQIDPKRWLGCRKKRDSRVSCSDKNSDAFDGVFSGRVTSSVTTYSVSHPSSVKSPERASTFVPAGNSTGSTDVGFAK
jgi:hypothetical protein